MAMTDINIVLASASPSRKMLFENLGIDFKVLVSGVDETVPDGLSPAQTVELLSRRKLDAVVDSCKDSAVIAADSIILVDGRILGKPEDMADAKKMLSGLAGRTHQVYTGVSIGYNRQVETFSQYTSVRFYPLTEEEIEEYVNSGESMGRAGSYGIEGKGALLIESIDGDYFNVVGLPLAATFRLLKKMTG